MPLENRVTPFGEIVAVPERGTFMGNRGGCFHTAARTLTSRRWASRRWIVCLLEFKGRKREVMAPHHYTELFFLDEATALAAGHRPCAECRRTDHHRFKDAWLRGNASRGLPADVRIDEIDRVLHGERLAAGGLKVTFRAPLGELPDGTFVVLDEAPSAAYLLARGALWRWAPGGYAGPVPRKAEPDVIVLTPRSTVDAIAAGYWPSAHESIGAGG
jgi:hypothetical protein